MRSSFPCAHKGLFQIQPHYQAHSLGAQSFKSVRIHKSYTEFRVYLETGLIPLVVGTSSFNYNSIVINKGEHRATVTLAIGVMGFHAL